MAKAIEMKGIWKSHFQMPSSDWPGKANSGRELAMEKVSFGRSGLEVSKLCFGTVTIGSGKWKPWALDEADSLPILKRALGPGVNFFDLPDGCFDKKN